MFLLCFRRLTRVASLPRLLSYGILTFFARSQDCNKLNWKENTVICFFFVFIISQIHICSFFAVLCSIWHVIVWSLVVFCATERERWAGINEKLQTMPVYKMQKKLMWKILRRSFRSMDLLSCITDQQLLGFMPSVYSISVKPWDLAD